MEYNINEKVKDYYPKYFLDILEASGFKPIFSDGRSIGDNDGFADFYCKFKDGVSILFGIDYYENHMYSMELEGDHITDVHATHFDSIEEVLKYLEIE